MEVFGNNDETVLSDAIFPAGSSQGIEFYSRGGQARIVKLEVWNLRSAWTMEDQAGRKFDTRPAK